VLSDSPSLKTDIQKFLGEGEYNTPSNPCWGDGYFAKSLEEKWGKSIEELVTIYREGGDIIRTSRFDVPFSKIPRRK
jgi:hypothetical protein